MSEECSVPPHTVPSEAWFQGLSSAPTPGRRSAECLTAACGFSLTLLPLPHTQLSGQTRGSGGARALDWELDLEYNPNTLAGACLFPGPRLLHVKRQTTRWSEDPYHSTPQWSQSVLQGLPCSRIITWASGSVPFSSQAAVFRVLTSLGAIHLWAEKSGRT